MAVCRVPLAWYKAHNHLPIRIAHVLSKRQLEILQALANGLSNKEIARQLDIVESTVKVQLKTIYRKINVRNRTEAALAIRFFQDSQDMEDSQGPIEGTADQKRFRRSTVRTSLIQSR